MADGRETELKLAASPAMLAQLRNHPLLAGADAAQTLVARYFDTPEASLHSHGATLRVRDDGGAREQTFKSSGKGSGNLHRREWNLPASGPTPDPSAFPADARELLDPLLDGASLRALATTRVARTTRRLHFGGSTIEAAFDEGAVEAGRRQRPIAELELELLTGDAADLFALARQLPLGPELGWSTESKGARGHVLALKIPFAALRASAVPLTPTMTVAEGFRAIAWNCLAQLLGNYREVIASGDADAVHQTRVAIRRLRAAFSLFGNHVADAQSPVFRAEWKAAANALGPARDLDVFLERVAKSTEEESNGPIAAMLVEDLRQWREEAFARARTAVGSARFRGLVADTAAWIEFGDWTQGTGDRASALRDKPIAAMAADELGRRWRKILRGARLDGLDPQRQHELRIRAKKLRYASEFFVPRILKNHFTDGYPLKHAYKDLVSGATLGANMNVPMPVLAAATATYQMALLRGHGKLDKGAMIKVYEELLGVGFRAKAN